jgi:predicted metal-dependent phosphoesterase TrpH
MMRADFHCHTHYSHDCFASPGAVLETARRRGLTHLAITDHDSIEGALRTRDKSPDVQIIIGCEVSLAGGVHLIGLFLQKPVTSKSAADVVAEIRAQGGFVYVPHPFHPQSGALAIGIDAKLLTAVDAIEVCNGHEPAARNTLALDLARAYRLPALAGSDAHYGIDVGRACVELPDLAGPLTPELLRTARRRIFGPIQDASEIHATDSRLRATTAPRVRKFAPQAARRLAKWLLWARCRRQLKAQLREPVRQEFHG